MKRMMFRPRRPLRRGKAQNRLRRRASGSNKVSFQGDETAPHWIMPIIISAGVALLVTGLRKGWL